MRPSLSLATRDERPALGAILQSLATGATLIASAAETTAPSETAVVNVERDTVMM